MRSLDNPKPYMIERIVSALTYPTMGGIGFIWLLLGVFTQAKLRPFTAYHIYQSIFLAIAYVVVAILLGVITNILSVIPLINKLIAQISFWLNMPAIFGYSLIQACIYTVIIYLTVTAFMGKFSYLPWVSNIIKPHVR